MEDSHQKHVKELERILEEIEDQASYEEKISFWYEKIGRMTAS